MSTAEFYRDEEAGGSEISRFTLVPPEQHQDIIDPEPPRTVGEDVFKVKGDILDTDSRIPDDAIVTAVTTGRQRAHWWSRKEVPVFLEKPGDKAEFLVRDIVAGLAPAHEGFQIEQVGRDGRVIDVMHAHVVRPGVDTASQLSNRGSGKDKFVYPTASEAPQEPHVSNRRRGGHTKPTLVYQA